MRDSVLLLSASPHKNGTTSRISALIEDGCRRAGFRTAVLDFSGMNFLGCTHCGTCSQRLRHCPLEGKDDCSETFATIIGSRYLVIVSPIYNYGLPHSSRRLLTARSISIRQESSPASPPVPPYSSWRAGQRGRNSSRGRGSRCTVSSTPWASNRSP